MTQEEQTNVAATKKKFYKKWWFWAIIIIFVIAIASSGGKSKESVADTNKTATAQPASTDTVKKPDVPVEYMSALAKAETYSATMHMSKQGLYDQLVSSYGEQFTPQAAQYAIDNVKADWNANALAKAKTYQDTMHMSPVAIHDQLTSSSGEKFTQPEADYAIQHLNS